MWQMDREAAARGASVRNFGLIWVSGRAGGPELAAAKRGRELWEKISQDAPAIAFRAAGSITVARTAAEWAVAVEAVNGIDADERGFTLLSADRVRSVNPALRGQVHGGLYSSEDAVVEPRVAQLALRRQLLADDEYEWCPAREARSIDATAVTDDHGDRRDADVVIICPGATLPGLVRELEPDVPVHRVRLQMMQTAALDTVLTTAVADADSFRYYPAYAGHALDALNRDQPAARVAARNGMQLLMVQRSDGGLTIGDTHAYDEPFDFDVSEDPYRHLAEVAGALLGCPIPAVERRWAGVYAQSDTPGQLVHRREVRPGVWLVLGPGGRGMTCAPAIAEQTIQEAGL